MTQSPREIPIISAQSYADSFMHDNTQNKYLAWSFKLQIIIKLQDINICNSHKKFLTLYITWLSKKQHHIQILYHKNKSIIQRLIKCVLTTSESRDQSGCIRIIKVIHTLVINIITSLSLGQSALKLYFKEDNSNLFSLVKNEKVHGYSLRKTLHCKPPGIGK